MSAVLVNGPGPCSEARDDGPLPVFRPWYAIFTQPRHEKKVAQHLHCREVESYLPTLTSVRAWRNRQRKKLELPLFPGYLYARVSPNQRSRILGTPGVVTIVEGAMRWGAVPDQYIELLRKGLELGRVQRELLPVVGDRVRIKCGPFAGLEGVLSHVKSQFRVVVTIESIRQSISLEVGHEEIESRAGRSFAGFGVRGELL